MFGCFGCRLVHKEQTPYQNYQKLQMPRMGFWISEQIHFLLLKLFIQSEFDSWKVYFGAKQMWLKKGIWLKQLQEYIPTHFESWNCFKMYFHNLVSFVIRSFQGTLSPLGLFLVGTGSNLDWLMRYLWVTCNI